MSNLNSTAILSLGTNIEPREKHLAQARSRINDLPSTEIFRESSIIETEPVDVPEEFQDKKFLNQVVIIKTSLDVNDFSNKIHKIEDEMGVYE
jgi:2-amino-4-hydroxy-6-hydroxymethyldihydropteridine diphosphokinase